MTTPPLSLAVSSSLEPLRPVWDALVADRPDAPIFLTWDWHEQWWRFLGEGQLALLVARDGAEVVGIAPLVRVDDDLGPRWEFGGGAEVADFLDILARKGWETEVADVVLGALSELGGRVHLRNLRPDSVVMTHLVPEARRLGLDPIVEIEDVSPRVELPSTWDAYLQRLSKKDRHELRRKVRRLSAAGRVEYGPVAATDYAAADLADFVRLHRSSAEAKAVFMTPAMEGFFSAILATFIPRGCARLYFLRVDGQRVAATIVFDEPSCDGVSARGADPGGGEARRGAFLLYNSGYDPAYADLSVGLLLKAFCLRDAIEEGKAAFDFLQGHESYKYDLGAVDTPIYRLRLDLDVPR